MPKDQEQKLQGFLPEEQLEKQAEFEVPKEITKETDLEKKQEIQEQKKETGFKIPKFRQRPTTIPNKQDPQIQQIEKILEQGLKESYNQLSPIAKEEFKLKGEQTAQKINELLKSTHIKAKKVLKLILDWLKMLPGVNKFFLEQEAKIKTDRIISLKK